MDEQKIKLFSDDQLLSSLSGLFQSERKTSRLIVLHLIEVEARKLYLNRGFDSLFRMLVEFYKLSESSAYRRIQSMRLIRDVPQAQQSLVTGELNFATLSRAQSQIRHEEKLTGEKISIAKKAEILETIRNKTQAQAEVELFKLLPNAAAQPKTHERRVSESTVRVSHNLPDRVLNKLKRLQEIWSHVNPNMGYAEIIERCADEVLERVDLAGKVAPTDKSEKKVRKHRLTKMKKQGVTNQRAYIPLAVKRAVHARAESCCEFIDPKTGRRCRSKFLTQTDHKIPIWAGGSNELENLQLLCSAHNRLKYRQETNTTFVSDQAVPYQRRFDAQKYDLPAKPPTFTAAQRLQRELEASGSVVEQPRTGGPVAGADLIESNKH